MSDDIARDTLRAVTAQELLEVDSELHLPTDPDEGLIEALHSQARALYIFGNKLQGKALENGWEDHFGTAFRSGAHRFSLSLLNLLSAEAQPESRSITKGWLMFLGPSIDFRVKDVVSSVLDGDEGVDDAADRVEAELDNYPAFADLSSELVAYLMEEGLTTDTAPIQEASVARLGAALTGLSIKRKLDGYESKGETLYMGVAAGEEPDDSVDQVAIAMKAWFDLPSPE